VREYLGRFGFYGEEVFKKVRELSGGELTRLALAKILLERPNVLILDEPTNNLDVLTIQSLEKTLKEYKGAIIFVSHDEYFIKNIADKFILIDDGESIESKELNDILDNIKSSSFKLDKKKVQNISYKEKNRIKNRIKSLNNQLLYVRSQADTLFKKLDKVEVNLFEFGDDYNKVIELMEEKVKLEKELLELENMEKEIVEELLKLEKNKNLS
ncbi:MAG: ATP-binding cassette domain-containing protein, partial [Defluviitoga tunisiensis]